MLARWERDGGGNIGGGQNQDQSARSDCKEKHGDLNNSTDKLSARDERVKTLEDGYVRSTEYCKRRRSG